jgi:hypothetical protein
MPVDIKILSRGDIIPEGDHVRVTTRLAENNSIVTDIICIVDNEPVKTITDRQLREEIAIQRATQIADDHEVDVVYVQTEI